MENASKALLIAGAILLVIAIIAIAVGIVSSTRNTIGQAELQITAMEIKMHNAMFEKYEGKRKTYTELSELANEIAAYNSNTKNSALKVQLISAQYKDDKVTYERCCYFNGGLITQYRGCPYFSFEYNNGSNLNALYDIILQYNENGIVNNIIGARLHEYNFGAGFHTIVY